MTSVDVTLLGATGYVGKLTAQALADSAGKGLSVCLAGRDKQALEDVVEGLGTAAKHWTIQEADTSDAAAMDRLAESSKVIASTVGPFEELGWHLVSACAQAGTHCVDLAGEVPFMARSINELHDVAAASGAKVIHACGFDSLPSDIAAMLAYDAAAGLDAGAVTSLVGQFRSVKGGISGGTVASMRGVLARARRDADVRRIVQDPYALTADRSLDPVGVSIPDSFAPYRDLNGFWVCPFFMSPINTRVVRRSLSLRSYEHGPATYQEVLVAGQRRRSALAAGGLSLGTRAGLSAVATPGLGSLVAKALPSPGQGPRPATLKNGKFTLVTRATTESGARAEVSIHGYRDPGYALTGVMLAQSALCLAQDSLPARGGVLTPATAFGSRIVGRLAGPDFEFALSQPGAA